MALIIFSCFFVVMSALLYDQYLELFIYCLIMMWVLTALLLRVHTGDLHQDYLIRMLSQSGVIFLQALPLGLFLFFFFPRYTGVLSFSLDEARIGITDDVTPGSIAKLSRDGSLAMTVRFDSPNVPSIDRMYWRAVVLWQYSGGAWTPGPIAGALESHREIAATPEPSGIVQTITLKANNQRWLLALDVPTTKPINNSEASSWASLLSGHVAQLTTGKLNHMVRYDVTSSSATIDEPLNEAERRAALQLPNDPKGEHINHSVIELADHLHQGFTDDQEQEYIAAVMHFFRGGNFEYSTTPGVQGPDWLPVFLFKTRSGFCEHFAAAFAVLMRIEHVPARLVVGYQGADSNPYSDVYGVSESNAPCLGRGLDSLGPPRARPESHRSLAAGRSHLSHHHGGRHAHRRQLRRAGQPRQPTHPKGHRPFRRLSPRVGQRRDARDGVAPRAGGCGLGQPRALLRPGIAVANGAVSRLWQESVRRVDGDLSGRGDDLRPRLSTVDAAPGPRAAGGKPLRRVLPQHGPAGNSARRVGRPAGLYRARGGSVP